MAPMTNDAAASLVTDAIQDLLDQVRPNRDGELADYIPQLLEVDPEGLALSVVTPTGHIYSAGDDHREFTMQSASKPFVYALALAEHGHELVHERVGVEPSGEPFNAISLDGDGRPANPMINAGAIVTSALIGGQRSAERFERIRAIISAFAGRELDVDEAVYESEVATGHRNRALAYLALSAGTLVRPVEEATAVYFRQCSIKVTSRDLAVMGATLANNGLNPLTGVQVVQPGVVRRTLAVMLSCGMYNYSGYWMNDVGLPAKSGVGGGIIAVAPGRFGVGTYSPRLDAHGSSVRGVQALRLMSANLGLHILNHPSQAAASFIGSGERQGQLSMRMHGELDFASIEHLAHEVDARSAGLTHVHVDLHDSKTMSPTARGVLKKMRAKLANHQIPVTVDDPQDIFTTEEIPVINPEG